jgi:GPH family glycoside/pentoside/hexuronide:cation symporter
VSALKEEIVPLKSRIWVSAADGATATLQGLAGSAVLTYYFTRWRGLDIGLAAIVWLLFGIWNAINDPLFGYISDRTKSNLGRRIPYIRYGAPILALSFIACWMDWPGSQTNQALMFVQMLLFLFVFVRCMQRCSQHLHHTYEMAVSNKAQQYLCLENLVSTARRAVPLILVPSFSLGREMMRLIFAW